MRRLLFVVLFTSTMCACKDRRLEFAQMLVDMKTSGDSIGFVSNYPLADNEEIRLYEELMEEQAREDSQFARSKNDAVKAWKTK